MDSNGGMLMIVGRTPEGRIKTLSDGGLRAVNCACCGSQCGCSEVKIPNSLLPTFRNAANAYCNGVDAQQEGYWFVDQDYWEASWFIDPFFYAVSFEKNEEFNPSNCMYASAAAYTEQLEINGVFHAGNKNGKYDNSETCCDFSIFNPCSSPIVCYDTPFTINGLTFNGYQSILSCQSLVTIPVPNFQII
jgi:hypothetical protein